eukprot:TRINITY_DN7329_c0_g1_i1.p1 TRINITY_DN7329_c0_g1~~TRINITY_DN7329_c0_g1_i1.p1  ORF type:complete len:386 (+),score=60.87 TRINITY_DN7329_c0_g1_i1:65-1222(+)
MNKFIALVAVSTGQLRHLNVIAKLDIDDVTLFAAEFLSYDDDDDDDDDECDGFATCAFSALQHRAGATNQTNSIDENISRPAHGRYRISCDPLCHEELNDDGLEADADDIPPVNEENGDDDKKLGVNRGLANERFQAVATHVTGFTSVGYQVCPTHGKVMTLYHQTGCKQGRRILQEGFHAGRYGWCGGGIYFAATPQATDHKAIGVDSHKGFIIQAQVLIGNAIHADRHCKIHGRTLAGNELHEAGHDTMIFDPGDGVEHVVYCSSQVLSTKHVAGCHYHASPSHKSTHATSGGNADHHDFSAHRRHHTRHYRRHRHHPHHGRHHSSRVNLAAQLPDGAPTTPHTEKTLSAFAIQSTSPATNSNSNISNNDDDGDDGSDTMALR